MSIADKPLDKVTESDLTALISDKESEGKTIEYKRDPVGTSDGDKKEFLADVSSFANTLGGHLIFGMEESGGLPTKLVGLPGINSDREILRLEGMIRDGIRPPIIGLRIQPAPLGNKNVALLVRIPKSWNPPHQVTFQKAFRFYARASNGKYLLDVDELRSIYSLTSDVAQRLRLFRIERIAKIVADDAPVQLEPGAKLVVHLLPISAFGADQQFDLKVISGDLNNLISFLGSGGSSRFNLDGLFLAAGTPARRYAQVFRNGCLEVVGGFSGEANASNCLPSPALEGAIIEHVRDGKKLLQQLGAIPPFVVMVTLLGVKGWTIRGPHGSGSLGVFDREPLFIPELYLEAFDGDAKSEAKPLLETIWNAAGSPDCPPY
jgi:hypothetical protein